MGEFEVYEAIVGDDTLDQLIQQFSNLLDDLKRYRDASATRSTRLPSRR